MSYAISPPVASQGGKSIVSDLQANGTCRRSWNQKAVTFFVRNS